MAAGAVDLPWLLRTWRVEVARASQRVVAEAVGVSKSTLSMWETGRRRPGVAEIESLDRCYDAGGALVDLALSLGTPRGLPARRLWAYNPQGPSGPRWAWLRPQPGAHRVDALFLWAAFAFDCSHPCGERGLFVTAPVSMPNPSAWVQLREPGWVDFGRGEIPAELGVPAVAALSAAKLAGGSHSPVGLVAPSVVERFVGDPAFADAVVRFFGHREDLVRQVFSSTEVVRRIVDRSGDRSKPAVRRAPFTGEQYRVLREARGLSQLDAARLATDLLPTEPVSDDQIGVLENGGRPRPQFLGSRLDVVYRADGYTCVEEVAVAGGRPPFRVEFPSYWIGPVWVTFRRSGAAPRTTVRLQFGIHVQHIAVSPGTTVTCRRGTPDEAPLIVSCPDGWSISAGVGLHPEARDVNWGWQTANDVSSRGDAPVHELFLDLFGRSRPEFDELLRRFDAS